MIWTSVRGHKEPVKRADVHRDLKDSNPNTILFYSILFYSILFYSILFYPILFYSILFHTVQYSRYFRYNPNNKRNLPST